MRLPALIQDKGRVEIGEEEMIEIREAANWTRVDILVPRWLLNEPVTRKHCTAGAKYDSDGDGA